MKSAGVNIDTVMENVLAQRCDSLAGWWNLLIEKEQRKESRRQRRRAESRRISAASNLDPASLPPPIPEGDQNLENRMLLSPCVVVNILTANSGLQISCAVTPWPPTCDITKTYHAPFSCASSPYRERLLTVPKATPASGTSNHVVPGSHTDAWPPDSKTDAQASHNSTTCIVKTLVSRLGKACNISRHKGSQHCPDF